MFFKKNIRHFIYSLIFIFFLNSGCSNSDSEETLHFENAYFRLPLIGSDFTSGYLNIANKSDNLISITGISCLGVKLSSFHETLLDQNTGTMLMEKIEPFEIAPNKEVIFMPGGKHIMVTGISEDLIEGDKIKCKIFADSIGVFKVEFEIT